MNRVCLRSTDRWRVEPGRGGQCERDVGRGADGECRFAVRPRVRGRCDGSSEERPFHHGISEGFEEEREVGQFGERSTLRDRWRGWCWVECRWVDHMRHTRTCWH